MRKELKIFIDFDGTITTTDVGENIFLKFGNVERVKSIIKGLLDEDISSKECWISLCEAVPHINKNELDDFIDEIKIDPGFKDFIAFCNENGITYFILSDGFDYYIERILKKEKLNAIKFFSNELKIVNNKLFPSFPHHDIDFPGSANCKKNHIINNSGDEEFTVFIGDGNSDKYTIHYCDLIFAKNDLLKYCERERIPYYPFENFNDIKNIIAKLLSRKRLKKRHQAELKRREAYMQE